MRATELSKSEKSVSARGNKNTPGRIHVIGKDFSHRPGGGFCPSIISKTYEKGELFAKEYVKSFNAVTAAKTLGYKITEQRRKSNSVSRPHKKFAYQIEKEMEKMGEIVKSQGVTPEQVIEEITQIAFNSDGEFCSNPAMKITTKDKLKALDMLMKYLGLYERDNKQKVAEQQVLQIAFVGADAVEEQIRQVQKQKEILADSVTKSPELQAIDAKLREHIGVSEKTKNKG